MNRSKMAMVLALCHVWTLGSPALAGLVGNPHPKAKARKTGVAKARREAKKKRGRRN